MERAMELTGARYGAALVRGPDGQIEDFLHRGLTPEQVAELPHLPEGKGLLGLVLEEERPVMTEKIGSHPASVGFPARHVPMEAFLGVPMKYRDELVGALYLSKAPGDPSFNEADEEVAAAMAAMAAVGIENVRLMESEAERAERSRLLREIASEVRRTLDTRQVLATTVELLGNAAAVDRCFIRLADPDSPEGIGKIEAEWDHEEVDPLRADPERTYPVSSLAAKTRSTQWSEDISNDERLVEAIGVDNLHELLAHTARAVLASPLLWAGEFIGVVSFHSEKPRKWTESDIWLIEGAAREAAIALSQARLYGDAVDTAEELRRLDKLRHDFVSMVSHELRSPMTVIAGIADLLQTRSDRLTQEQRGELVQTLGREAKRLARLVSEVLDLETIEQGNLRLQAHELDLVELAEEAIADAGQAGRARLEAAEGPMSVRADRDRIKQVFINLLSNADKFSPSGSPITVAVRGQHDAVEVSVEDRGPGIPSDEMALLFERFTRLDAGRHQPGSGLGLYLSKAIVEQHGGEMSVESTVGEGTTFSFRLPKDAAAETAR